MICKSACVIMYFITVVNGWRNNLNEFLNCSCGQFTSQKRMIDGALINDGEHPWLVGVLNKGNQPSVPLCYGALISDRHILTAASCVEKRTSHDIAAFFYGKGIMKNRKRTVVKIDVHKDYIKLNHNNNLAILTLVLPFKLETDEGQMISPICIPNPYIFTRRLEKMNGIMIIKQYFKTVLVGAPKYYFGWVPTKIHGIRNPKCSNVYSERTKDKTLCADDHGSFCYGNEGSPLSMTLSQSGLEPVSPDKGRFYVVGIYSKGYGCDGYQKGKSGVDVSTNILKHTDWIISKTRDGFFCS